MSDYFEPNLNPKISKKSKNIHHSKNEKHHSSNTIPSIKENEEMMIINNQSQFQTINQTSKSFQMTIDDKAISKKNNSKPKTRNNSKIPSSMINNESSLLKNIKFLDSDNLKLREALNEINLELQEKEEELNESQKLIKKINNEYTHLLNQYKSLDEEKNNLRIENQKLQKICDNLNKNLKNKEIKEKQNEQIQSELIKTKEMLNNLKGNYSNISVDLNKMEKESKYKEIIIKDLKIEGNKIVNMLKDRDLLIQEYNKKISELNNIIKQKDEQLKLMLNFSKELNDENKSNIKEITKQAVKTINIFYNSRKSNEDKNNINLIEIRNKDYSENLDNNDNINDFLSKNNCSFLIKNAIKTDLFIPDTGINFINKEFLEENNFKTCLIKTELYSSILREFNLINYLNDLSSQFKEYINNVNLQKNNEKYMKSLKSFQLFHDKIFKNLVETKNENYILKAKLNGFILYTRKLKQDFSNNNKKLKEKIEKINNQYNLYMTKLENKNNKSNNYAHSKECNNGNESKIISELHKENDKIKNINHNLSEEILNKEEIIKKLRDENNKLINKLNLLRTNPYFDNDSKFYNSYSTKENSNYPRKLFSNKSTLNNNSRNNLKIYKNKNFVIINDKKNIDKNSNHKKVNKGFNNLKEKVFNKNDNKSENESKFINDKNNLKSNSFNKKKFVKLQMKIQNNFSYLSNNHLNENKNHELNEKQKNSETNIDENRKNILSVINSIKDFISKINKENFIDIINRIFNINNIILIITNKIGEIKNNFSLIKENFKNNNKDKKIKSSQLLDIVNDVENLLFYLFNQLKKCNINSQKILPFLKVINDLILLISCQIPLGINNKISFCPINNDINTLFNTSSCNSYNCPNSKKNLKDIILENNINHNNKSKKGKDIQIFHNLFYINNKIFSSSELIKYHSIYEGLELSELISVFKEICKNFKSIILNSKFNYDTDISDFEENKEPEKNKYNDIITENNTYHLVNEKIFGLKKFEFNLKLFFELLKNYLVVFEFIVKQIEINNNKLQNQKEIQKILNVLYEIFEDSSCLNINSLDDNIIFCRKLLLTLLLNHKEYLLNYICIFYD